MGCVISTGYGRYICKNNMWHNGIYILIYGIASHSWQYMDWFLTPLITPFLQSSPSVFWFSKFYFLSLSTMYSQVCMGFNCDLLMWCCTASQLLSTEWYVMIIPSWWTCIITKYRKCLKDQRNSTLKWITYPAYWKANSMHKEQEF